MRCAYPLNQNPTKMKTTNVENQQTNKVEGKVFTTYLKADGKSANVKLVYQHKLLKEFSKLAAKVEAEMLKEFTDEKEAAKIKDERETIVQAFEKKYYAGAGVEFKEEKISAEELALLEKFKNLGFKI